MTNFPNRIVFNCIEAGTNKAIEGICIMITLFAHSKNNYHMIPSNSDANGQIIVTKKWIKEKIKEDKDLFIMDYASELEDCLPKILITLLGTKRLERIIESLRIFNAPEKEINVLLLSTNKYYKTFEQNISIENEEDLYETLSIQNILS